MAIVQCFFPPCATLAHSGEFCFEHWRMLNRKFRANIETTGANTQEHNEALYAAVRVMAYKIQLRGKKGIRHEG